MEAHVVLRTLSDRWRNLSQPTALALMLTLIVSVLRAGGFEQGFSTITMQLARNLFPERIPGREQSLARKLVEVRVAKEIEQRFSKQEILELYLNHIYFCNRAPGIEAAARQYFGVPAVRLPLPQAALLGALPQT